MEAINKDSIRSFILQQVEHWNAGEKEKMMSMYRRMAPNGLKMELVGHPVIDGWQALNEMWDRDNGHIKGEIVDVMVNGNEGACYCRNVRTADGTVVTSIEIFCFEDGTLHVRYFH